MIQINMDWSEQARMPIEPTSAQCDALLRSMQQGARYTVASAISSLGIYALSQRCGELRKLGWPIKDQFVTLPNGKKVKEYWI
jgi:hypothetical protein